MRKGFVPQLDQRRVERLKFFGHYLVVYFPDPLVI